MSKCVTHSQSLTVALRQLDEAHMQLTFSGRTGSLMGEQQLLVQQSTEATLFFSQCALSNGKREAEHWQFGNAEN